MAAATFYAAKEYTVTGDEAWNAGMNIAKETYQSASKWIEEKALPYQIQLEGIPYPYSLSDFLSQEPELKSFAHMLDPGLSHYS